MHYYEHIAAATIRHADTMIAAELREPHTTAGNFWGPHRRARACWECALDVALDEFMLDHGQLTDDEVDDLVERIAPIEEAWKQRVGNSPAFAAACAQCEAVTGHRHSADTRIW